MTYKAFIELFPNDDACLAYLKERFYPDGTKCPRCGKPSRFRRIAGRTAYSCQFCGSHVYPAARTLFHRSRVGLQRWFWAVLLVSSTRGAISVPELEAELGVSYKTAQRMLELISGLIGDGWANTVDRPAPVPSAPPATPAPNRRRAWHGRRRRT